jgi:hypothetical protein
MTVEEFARWTGTSVGGVRLLGLRGRISVSVDAYGLITHVAVPPPEPPEPDDAEADGAAPHPEEAGRLSLVPDVEGAVSVAPEPSDD